MSADKVSPWVGKTHYGDVRERLVAMADAGVLARVCVTSPPYWGLREYNLDARMIGLEPTMHLWVANMQHVFNLVWDVLEPDGTLWLNLGDASVSTGGAGFQGKHGQRGARRHTQRTLMRMQGLRTGLAPKNLMGMPWRVAFALQDTGWILRRAIIWEKPNAMPESVRDRPSSSYETIFLFSKQRHYCYDAKAVTEATSPNTHLRMSQDLASQQGSFRANAGFDERPMKAGGRAPRKKVAGWAEGKGSHSTKAHARDRSELKTGTKFGREPGWRNREAQNVRDNESFSSAISAGIPLERNLRDVWRIPTEPFKGAHFATFPREIPRRAIMLGSKPGDIILDPFMGTGTTAQVAESIGRRWVGIELDPACEAMFQQLRKTTMGLAL